MIAIIVAHTLSLINNIYMLRKFLYFRVNVCFLLFRCLIFTSENMFLPYCMAVWLKVNAWMWVLFSVPVFVVFNVCVCVCACVCLFVCMFYVNVICIYIYMSYWKLVHRILSRKQPIWLCSSGTQHRANYRLRHISICSHDLLTFPVYNLINCCSNVCFKQSYLSTIRTKAR